MPVSKVTSTQRPATRAPTDRERLERGRRRLEEILRDPGPGIEVIPRTPSAVPPSPARENAASTLAAAEPRSPTLATDDSDAAPRRAPRKEHAPRRERAPRREPRADASRNRPSAKTTTREPHKRQPEGKIEYRPGKGDSESRAATDREPPAPAPPRGPVAAPREAGRAAERPSERPQPEGSGELTEALLASKSAFMSLGLFSLVINILMLAGPLFMLQVYDRVISSGSIPTLVALTALTAFAYAIIGVLEIVRSRVIVRIGHAFDSRVSGRVFDAAIRTSALGAGKQNGALRELDALRQFVGSPGPLAFFDAPWTPVYLLIIFAIHPVLGLAAVIGAAILMTLTWISETQVRQPLGEAGKTAARSLEIAETGQRNAEAIAAMGMGPDLRRLWLEANTQSLAWQLLASDRLGTMTASSKTLRLLMQSLMLAVGAWLAVEGEITAGAIVAGTIIFGRALAPVEQAIGHWRPFVRAREAFDRLGDLLKSLPPERTRTALPRPRGTVEVKALKVASPETRQVILSGIGFRVEPGQMLAVIGPSASGKSTLVRTLVGLWAPASGTLTLDGARLDQWHPEDLGRHIGYLPQSVELFAGTVRQNIARFAPDASDDEVLSAARAAHAHDLILALPKGYDTELGSFGTYLSGGQRQRIALARALFRFPPLIVLDEPNANLDRDGDVALASAIDGMRARQQTVVLVSHRVQAIGKADLLLLLEKGQLRAFGPRDAILRRLQGEAPPGPTAPAAAPPSEMPLTPAPDTAAASDNGEGAINAPAGPTASPASSPEKAR